MAADAGRVLAPHPYLLFLVWCSVLNWASVPVCWMNSQSILSFSQFSSDYHSPFLATDALLPSHFPVAGRVVYLKYKWVVWFSSGKTSRYIVDCDVLMWIVTERVQGYLTTALTVGLTLTHYLAPKQVHFVKSSLRFRTWLNIYRKGMLQRHPNY